MARVAETVAEMSLCLSHSRTRRNLATRRLYTVKATHFPMVPYCVPVYSHYNFGAMLPVV
jgi:hypothetical protein